MLGEEECRKAADAILKAEAGKLVRL